MKVVDKRCVYLSRTEVKEILIKALCDANPGFGVADEKRFGDCVDLSDLPPEIEVVLSLLPKSNTDTIKITLEDGRTATAALV